MDTSKIIKGVVSNGRYTVTAPIVKEDYGLYLKIEGVELPSTYEVDFSNSENSGTSVTMIGNADGVLIPHQFIDTGKDIFAFLYHVGANYGRTVYKFRIPNKVRPDRTDDEPTPEEQSTIDQLIGAMNTAVAQTAQDVVDAEASAQAAGYDADRAEEARSASSDYAEQAEASAISAVQSATASANSASASAQSASQSAQIKADVEELVDDAQASADASERSASNAYTYATSAERSSVNASASAQSASGYASNAQTSANTASAKAQDASTSAQTASAKASEASGYATTASNKATEASGYATSASQAKTDAESARDLAQGYASDAQGYANDAQASAESISASASQIAQNTANILKAFPTDTVSGSIASFSDGADDLPLKSLVVDINPVQDLSHGDPSPENICPISGWTEIDVEQSGKNLFDESVFADYGGTLLTSGVWHFNTLVNLLGKTLWTAPSTVGQITVTMWRKQGGVGSQGIRLIINYTDGSSVKVGNINSTGGTDVYTLTTDASKTVQDITGDYGSNQSSTDINVVICIGSTATPYEPYTGRSITINLGQTVYGGRLDVLSGVLTVNKAMVDLGTLTYDVNNHAILGQYFYASIIALRVKYEGAFGIILYNVLCSAYKVVPRSPTYLVNGTFCFDGNQINEQVTQIQIKNTAYTDAATFKAAMSGVQLCYELATPIEIQLSANQLNSLYGVNNIWADSGDTTAEYRANTKLWVQKKIAEAIASLS